MPPSDGSPKDSSPEEKPQKRARKIPSPQKISREKILKDLELLYQEALLSKNLSVALRTVELLGKELGLFHEKRNARLPSLEEMTEEELLAFLNSSKV